MRSFQSFPPQSLHFIYINPELNIAYTHSLDFNTLKYLSFKLTSFHLLPTHFILPTSSVFLSQIRQDVRTIFIQVLSLSVLFYHWYLDIRISLPLSISCIRAVSCLSFKVFQRGHSRRGMGTRGTRRSTAKAIGLEEALPEVV